MAHFSKCGDIFQVGRMFPNVARFSKFGVFLEVR